MESEKCKALLYAVECGTITQAAAELGYTVSGISKMIASLEQEVGMPLLVRGKTGVGMTQEGSVLAPYLKQVASSADNLEQKAAELKGLHCGSVRIGTSYQSYFAKLVSAIAAFTRDYPDIQIQLVEATSNRLYDMLHRDEVDLCIVSERNDGDLFTALGQDEIVAWLPPARTESVFPIREIEKESYIDIYPKEETDNSLMLKRLGLHVKSKYSASEIYAARSMVEAGLGIAFINRLWAEEIGGNVRTVPLKPRQAINIGLAEKEMLSPAAQKCKEYILQAISSAFS